MQTARPSCRPRRPRPALWNSARQASKRPGGSSCTASSRSLVESSASCTSRFRSRSSAALRQLRADRGRIEQVDLRFELVAAAWFRLERNAPLFELLQRVSRWPRAIHRALRRVPRRNAARRPRADEAAPRGRSSARTCAGRTARAFPRAVLFPRVCARSCRGGRRRRAAPSRARTRAVLQTLDAAARSRQEPPPRQLSSRGPRTRKASRPRTRLRSRSRAGPVRAQAACPRASRRPCRREIRSRAARRDPRRQPRRSKTPASRARSRDPPQRLESRSAAASPRRASPCRRR